MFKRLLLALAMATLPAAPALASALPAEPANFTMEVAMTTALQHNPSITAAQARLTQAKLDEQTAQLWWARAINANANYVVGNPYGGYTPNITATGLALPTAAAGIGMNLGDLLNGPRSVERAHANVVIAEADLRKTTLDVASAVTTAYADYQSAKRIAAMSPEMLQAAETDVRVMERSFERGGSQANTLVGARLAVNKTRVDQVTVNGNVAKSWATLLGLMGDDHFGAEPQTAEGR